MDFHIQNSWGNPIDRSPRADFPIIHLGETLTFPCLHVRVLFPILPHFELPKMNDKSLTPVHEVISFMDLYEPLFREWSKRSIRTVAGKRTKRCGKRRSKKRRV